MKKRHDADWRQIVDGAVDYLNSEQYADARKKQAKRFADQIDRDIFDMVMAEEKAEGKRKR